ncbi:hyaluronidase-2 [Trichomycterus rosablanca]|uniref:hyaluronidase-2 n=1 Tax=Trichomycterus rosablanca TaxID=2290929 RepID=UPI002F35E790
MANRFQFSWKLWLLLSIVLDSAKSLKSTRWPMYQNKPLLLAWNAPTEDCKPRYGVEFQLDPFHIVASPSESFVKQNLTIFYKDRLGFYPYYDENSNPINGGLPQSASLTQHLEKLPTDIKKYMPDTAAPGLAVIDWEEWRPLWIRNWDTKAIYKKQSILIVSQKNPTWDNITVAKVAQQEFELSARNFMLDTLRYAKSLRPNQLWGFYLFPDCYNHDYLQSMESYTGGCPDPELARNDQLNWLWKESTALFPSIYIGSILRSTTYVRYFVRNRIKEGMRVASLEKYLAHPVYVYARPTYANELTELTESDLVSTIGESVALGVAGIVLWGDSSYAQNSTTCSTLAEYVQGPLGRYLLNVTRAAEECSRIVCKSHGRCLRKNSDSDSYLHLNPQSYSIVMAGNKLTVTGSTESKDENRMKEDFMCQCFSGYMGEKCKLLDPFYKNGHGQKLEALWGLILLFTLVTLLS